MWKWIILVGYAVGGAILSLQPTIQSINIDHFDKVLHLGFYALFALLAHWLIREHRAFLVTCAAIALYSALIEVGQHFVPGRVMSLLDLVANVTGITLILFWRFQTVAPRNSTA